MNGRGWLPATRQSPEAAGLDATFRHASGWPVLSITGSPQAMDLVLVNRTPSPVFLGPALLHLVFRPGVLLRPEDIVLAPQSDAAWSLQIRVEPGEGNVGLLIAGVARDAVAPGAELVVRLDNVSADPAGGSRATRVQLHYRHFFHEDGREVNGTQLMHLPVLRRHEPLVPPATALRTGSAAEAGPLMAGFMTGACVLNDGSSQNLLLLRVVNTTGKPLPLSSDDDAATRFHLSFRTGGNGAPWGLLGSLDDHLSIEVRQPGWQVDVHTLRRVSDAPWGPRDALELELTLSTAAPEGDAQLVLRYENLPGQDDGDLVLLVHLGAFAARDGRLDVHAPKGLRVEGPVEATGAVRSGAPYPQLSPARFRLGGDLNMWYPVAFRDDGWHAGELRLEIFRPYTHDDGPWGSWRGSLMATFRCHASANGHGSDYLVVEVEQHPGATGNGRFVARVAQDAHDPLLIVWLRGDSSYAWLASHAVSRFNGDDALARPGPLSLPGGPCPVLAALDPGFDANHVSRRWTQTAMVDPVPAGAIVLWPAPGEPGATPLPAGWAICDGIAAKPDLRGASPPKLVYIRLADR